MGAADASVRSNDVRLQGIENTGQSVHRILMHRSVNEIVFAEGAFLLGFPISSPNRHSMRV
jgi:hypothetical protein